MNIGEIQARAAALPGAIGAALEGFGGILKCLTCQREQPLGAGDAGRYTSGGWPRCCGHTMRWITQRQLDEAARVAEGSAR